jgi:hypothetical protein
MPYRIVTYEEEESITVDCLKVFCIHNDGENHCEYDGDVEELRPDNPEYCNEKEYYMDPGRSKEFRDKDELNEFLSMFDEEEFSYQVVDEDSLRLLYVDSVCPSGKHERHRALIQVSEEHQNLYDYRPNTYGSFEIVPKNQVLLDLAE